MYAEIERVAVDARSNGLLVIVHYWESPEKTKARAANDFFWPGGLQAPEEGLSDTEALKLAIREYWKRFKAAEFYSLAPGIPSKAYPYQNLDGTAQVTDDDPDGVVTEELRELEGMAYEEEVSLRLEWPPGSGRYWEVII